MTTKPLDICLCTADFVGPIRNGGIGTAYHALALTLAQAGHRVSVLYALGKWSERGRIEDWIEHYRKLNIELIPAPPSPDFLAAACPYVRTSYETYLWLSGREKEGKPFDIVHFHEWRGLGFYCTLAKRQGLNFANTVLCVGAHSPHLWHQWGMKQHPASLDDLEADYLERTSVRWADVLVSPSQYLLDWMRENGWILPADSQVRQNILLDAAPSSNSKTQPVKEIVFFGRLETRKGLSLFCDALEVLCKDSNFTVNHRDLRISFVGKETAIEGLSSAKYIQDRATSWPLSWEIRGEMDHQAALAYLRQGGRLAVMPSLVENSPYTLLECLGNSIACLCTDLPGNRELIAEEDRQRVTFRPTPADLATRLRDTVEQGASPARPAIDLETTKRQWLKWHEDASASRKVVSAPPDQPLVSVCIAHRNRPAMLAQALQSIRDQEYPNVQVVLADDGSDTPEAIAYLNSLEDEFAKKNWKLIRQSNKYLGAARNAAAKAADGEWLLFMDDDNWAEPFEISTFIRAALSSGADVFTCLASCFKGADPPNPGTTSREIWLPLGGATAVGVFMNRYGDANGLYRREVFQKLGGFTEDRGVGHEDWELYARAALGGFLVLVVPRPLFWYRVAATSMLRTTNHYVNHMRSLRPYIQSVGPELSQALLLAQGLFFGLGGAVIPSTPAEPPPILPKGPPRWTDSTQGIHPQKLVDDYWNSLSWRMFHYPRLAASRLFGIPPPQRPRVHTPQEALMVVEAIRSSIIWEITGPLRAAGRVVHAMRHRNGKPRRSGS